MHEEVGGRAFPVTPPPLRVVPIQQSPYALKSPSDMEVCTTAHEQIWSLGQAIVCQLAVYLIAQPLDNHLHASDYQKSSCKWFMFFKRGISIVQTFLLLFQYGADSNIVTLGSPRSFH